MAFRILPRGSGEYYELLRAGKECGRHYVSRTEQYKGRARAAGGWSRQVRGWPEPIRNDLGESDGRRTDARRSAPERRRSGAGGSAARRAGPPGNGVGGGLARWATTAHAASGAWPVRSDRDPAECTTRWVGPGRSAELPCGGHGAGAGSRGRRNSQPGEAETGPACARRTAAGARPVRGRRTWPATPERAGRVGTARVDQVRAGARGRHRPGSPSRGSGSVEPARLRRAGGTGVAGAG